MHHQYQHDTLHFGQTFSASALGKPVQIWVSGNYFLDNIKNYH